MKNALFAAADLIVSALICAAIVSTMAAIKLSNKRDPRSH